MDIGATGAGSGGPRACGAQGRCNRLLRSHPQAVCACLLACLVLPQCVTAPCVRYVGPALFVDLRVLATDTPAQRTRLTNRAYVVHRLPTRHYATAARTTCVYLGPCKYTISDISLQSQADARGVHGSGSGHISVEAREGRRDPQGGTARHPRHGVLLAS